MKDLILCIVTALSLSGCASAATTADDGLPVGDDAGLFPTAHDVLDGGGTETDQLGGTKPDAPTVTILTPEDDAVFELGESIDFTASLSDSSDVEPGLSYAWESDLDGVLLSGDVSDPVLTADFDDLSAGAHLVTLTVTNPDGIDGTDTVAFRVNRPPSGETIVVIDPASPVTTDALTAIITQPATDPDGDPVTYTFTWRVDDEPSGISGETVPAQETIRGQQWRVTALPTDSHAAGLAGEASVTIGNTSPSVASVSVLPSAGYTDTTFSCEVDGWSDDDGDTQLLTYVWQVNDAEVVGAVDPSLDGSHFEKGDALRCAVTPDDGIVVGATVLSAPVPVLDSPPTVADVSLDPPEGDRNTVFTCSAEESADADDDPVTLQYVWILNGDALPGTTSETSEAIALASGDTLQCKVIPLAADVEGAPVSSQEVIIGNAPPLAGAVIMTPNPATELTEIACVVGESTDPDDDNVALSYTWYVNDVVVEGQTGSTLTGEHFDKGDAVLCEVVAFDGAAYSPPEASKVEVLVVNSPPALVGASIDPTEGSIQTPFTCVPGLATDPDPADTVTTTTLWQHDDTEVPGGIFETLTPDEMGLGPGTLTCIVTPTDGDDTGTPVVSTPATIVNHAPTIASVTLGPQPATSSDTLTCTPNGWNDVDGDPEAYLYEWSVGGVTLPDEHDETLSSEHFVKGDLVVCIATPTDEIDTGQPIPSNSLIIANSAPVASGAAIFPTVGGKLTEFTCSALGATDPDAGDTATLVFAYTWSINGELVVDAQASTFIPGSGVTTDATLTCTVTPYDLQAYGEPQTSGPALITNVAPVVESAVITLGDGGLYCVPQGASDADGDDVTLTYAWLINGLVAGGETDAFLSSSGLVKDDAVRCVVTPTDGTTTGQPVTSEPYVFSNDGPSTPAVTVSPADATPGDALTCTASANDPDDDDLVYSYTWLLDGEVQAAYTQATLPGGVAQACDTWTCEATATDGDATSDPGSDSVTLGPPGGDVDGEYMWHGHHSAPHNAGPSHVQTKNTFWSTERVATRITPDPTGFPMMLTHVRFYGTEGVYMLEVFTDGAYPMVSIGETTHQVTVPGMQVAELDAPIHLNGPMSVWVAVNGMHDYWVAAADKDGQATTNRIYGCPTFISGLGCIDLSTFEDAPFEWYPYTTFDNIFDSSWGTWGDIVADVGYVTGDAPATCD